MRQPIVFPLLLAAIATLANASEAPAQSEREISAGPLAGLHRDGGPGAPVVLIVPGSGPTDRDGNSPLGVNAGVYSKLAERLAALGVSSVRVDKRGMYSSAAAGDPNAVTVERYAEDYRAWIDAIRAATGAECVYLLGHSEGATMVSAAAIGRTDVCGLILVSGMGRPFGDVLREQLRANPANAPILEQAIATIERLEEGRHVDATALHPALLPLFHPAVQPYLVSLMAADPAALARQAGKPTLVVHGSTDLQTSLTDAKALAEATDGRLVVAEGVNHVLKRAPAERSANLATYADPGLPVADVVVEAIAEFVLARHAASEERPR